MRKVLAYFAPRQKLLDAVGICLELSVSEMWLSVTEWAFKRRHVQRSLVQLFRDLLGALFLEELTNQPEIFDDLLSPNDWPSQVWKLRLEQHDASICNANGWAPKLAREVCTVVNEQPFIYGLARKQVINAAHASNVLLLLSCNHML